MRGIRGRGYLAEKQLPVGGRVKDEHVTEGAVDEEAGVEKEPHRDRDDEEVKVALGPGDQVRDRRQANAHRADRVGPDHHLPPFVHRLLLQKRGGG